MAQPGAETANLTTEGADPRRWLALAVIVAAQLLVVLDASVVNIALPSAQQALGMSDVAKQWVVTGCSLTFGGLLLLGGKLADLHGRKRVFIWARWASLSRPRSAGSRRTPRLCWLHVRCKAGSPRSSRLPDWR